MAPTGFEGLKALIVEDNMHMRSLLRALLNSIGIAEITEATNRQAAIALLHAHSPDLVLTDLALTPMDPLEFARHIRNHADRPNPLVPIIIVSGHTHNHRRE